jgi:hypothetical protein
MKIVGISMIRNDADIVEAFVRHTLRALDHLFVIAHCPHDGTGEILAALQAEGLPITLVLDDEPAFLQGERLSWLAREAYKAIRCDFAFLLDADEFIVPPERDAIEAALASLPPDALAGGIRLRTFVPTSEDPRDEPHPLRRIRYHARGEDNVFKIVLTPVFATHPDWVIDHGNHALVHIGASERVPVPRLRGLALAHYPVRSAAQITNKTILGYLAHLAAGRPHVEERRVATHWRRCYEEIVLKGATRGMTEAQVLAWFHGRSDLRPDAGDLVFDPTPAPEPLRYAHLMRIDPYSTLARFTEAIVRSRPGRLEGARFDHATTPDTGTGGPTVADRGPHG